jgi:hypothetical protein
MFGISNFIEIEVVDGFLSGPKPVISFLPATDDLFDGLFYANEAYIKIELLEYGSDLIL